MSESEHFGLVLVSARVGHSEPQFHHLQTGVNNPRLTGSQGVHERIRACTLRTAEHPTNAVHSHGLSALPGGGGQQTGEEEWEPALNWWGAQLLVRKMG